MPSPRTDTPPLRPGTARRTTALDILPGPDGGLSATLRATGRDVVTGADGIPRATGSFAATGRVEETGIILELTVDGQGPDLSSLVGVQVLRGFHRALGGLVAATLPAGRAEPADSGLALARRVLADLPMSLRVARQTEMLDHPAVAGGLPVGPEGADACAGWRTDGDMMAIIRARKPLLMRLGPPAPRLEHGGDPLAWPALAELPRMATRRLRRTDVTRPPAGGTATSPDETAASAGEIDAHFRDHYVDPDGVARSLHEYSVTGRVVAAAGGGLELADVDSTAHALPWRDCFPAVASASRVGGVAVGAVGATVRAELRGISTCTHLNHTLRTLDDVADLLAQA